MFWQFGFFLFLFSRRYVIDFFYLIEEGDFLRVSTGNAVGVDKLLDEMKDMKIRGDKVNGMPSSFLSLSAFHRLQSPLD
jgi:hypothetical protein